jgi:hypothetical protein
MTGMGCNGWEEMPSEVAEIEQAAELPEGYRLFNSRQRLARGMVRLQRSQRLIEQSRERCA